MHTANEAQEVFCSAARLRPLGPCLETQTRGPIRARLRAIASVTYFPTLVRGGVQPHASPNYLSHILCVGTNRVASYPSATLGCLNNSTAAAISASENVRSSKRRASAGIAFSGNWSR